MPCRGKRGCLRKPSATSCHKINQCSWAVCLVTQSCPTLCDLMDWSQPGFSLPGDSSGKNTRVGGHALLQGILPTQGSNPHLPHYRQILFHLSHQGSPRILEWVAYPFSRASSWPRNWTGVSYIAGGFFTSWATREALIPEWVLKSKDLELFKALTTWSILHSIIKQREASAVTVPCSWPSVGASGMGWGRGEMMWYFDWYHHPIGTPPGEAQSETGKAFFPSFVAFSTVRVPSWDRLISVALETSQPREEIERDGNIMAWVIFLQCVEELSTVPALWALSSGHTTISLSHSASKGWNDGRLHCGWGGGSPSTQAAFFLEAGRMSDTPRTLVATT